MHGGFDRLDCKSRSGRLQRLMEKRDSLAQSRFEHDRDAPDIVRHFLQQLQPFRAPARLRLVKPVMLPPGRARPATKPCATGSLTPVKTMGTMPVARRAAASAVVALATIRSGPSASNSAVAVLALSSSATPHR